MIPRYQSNNFKQLFSDERKFATWFLVERIYLEAYLEAQGRGDQNLIQRLERAQTTIDWCQFAKRVLVYELEVKHDVIAFLQALEDDIGDDARLIHCGLTSSDVVDTALAIVIKEAHQAITKKLRAAILALWQKAEQNRGVLCLGRTHGQAAEPITFGIKLLSHLCEWLRGYQRLKQAGLDIAVGKLSGATGVYSLGGPPIESAALKRLGLSRETVATQVVARDRHAAYFATMATLAGSIERFAVEIRLLMHGQIKEASEPFSSKQKGSSAMPHKKNPILSENLCGLMRMMRAFAHAAMENQALWHERDISHSSVERIIIPDALSLMDFALSRLTALVECLSVDRERMSTNLLEQGAVLSSQKFMMALVEKGYSRKQAYEMVQRATQNTSSSSFLDALNAAGVVEILGEAMCTVLLETEHAVAHENELFNRVEVNIAELLTSE